MNYNTDKRAHDSGYLTPSPDKENKLGDSSIDYQIMEDASVISCHHNMANELNTTTQSTIRTSKSLESTKSTAKIPNTQSMDMDRPQHSYIALISMAILSKLDKKILLNEIYDWVVQHFPYYQHRTDKSWRNSIRHNLSLNECFIKVSKAGNGRGYYWSIHPANMTDFKKGDFRRRQARLRAKHDKAPNASSTGSSNRCTRTNSVEYIGNHHQIIAQQNIPFIEPMTYNQHQHSSTLYNANVVSTNETNTNYSNINCVPHSIHHSTATGPNHTPAYHHHHSSQNQQYNYVTFPWLPAAAAAAASSANNFLETITSSALACSYNTILHPHSYSGSNDMCSDNSLYYHHNFHNKS